MSSSKRKLHAPKQRDQRRTNSVHALTDRLHHEHLHVTMKHRAANKAKASRSQTNLQT